MGLGLSRERALIAACSEGAWKEKIFGYLFQLRHTLTTKCCISQVRRKSSVSPNVCKEMSKYLPYREEDGFFSITEIFTAIFK